MNQPLSTVSVVIPSHNYGRYLAEAIDSALAQTVPPGQIIVVDDGSTDNTADVAGRYQGRIDYVALPHGGLCRARNEGLRRATGEFVVFLDADDALDTRYLEKTLDAWHQAAEPKPAFIYTQRRDLQTGLTSSRHPAFDPVQLKFRNYIMVSALLRTGLARQQGFDSGFAGGLEDYDFFLGLVESGHSGLLLDEPLLRVRLHDNSRTRASGVPTLRWQLMRRLLEKHQALYSPAERRQFLGNLRRFMVDRIVEQRDRHQCRTERFTRLVDLLRYRAPFRVIFSQLFHVVKHPLNSPEEASHA